MYHVYNRFARGAAIFGEGDEAERILELPQRTRDREGLTVFAFCMMPSHYHLALGTGPVPLSRPMGFGQSRRAQEYNQRHRLTGPLWQSRFKAKVVEDDGGLGQLIADLHLNPVTAPEVTDSAEYRRSGHRELLRNAPSPLVDTDRTLGSYGKTPGSARVEDGRTLAPLPAPDGVDNHVFVGPGAPSAGPHPPCVPRDSAKPCSGPIGSSSAPCPGP